MPAAKIFTLVTTYDEADLPRLRMEQRADVAVIACYGKPLRRLRRFAHNDWRIDDAPIGSQITAPSGLTVTEATPGSGDTGYLASNKSYVVTALNDSGQESVPSNADTGVNDLSIKGDTNTLSWSAVTGASEYRAYELRSGVYGFLGRAVTTTFTDDNILGDFTIAPPTAYDPFADSQTPSTVAFHEGRLFTARTPLAPGGVFGSRIEDIFNFDRSRPSQASDSVTFGLRGRRVNAIQHLVSLDGALLALTNDAIWSIRSSGEGYLSPTSLQTRAEGYQGVNAAKPELIVDKLFYATARGSSVRALGYTFEKDGFRGNNLSVFAPHFFANYEITHFAWAEVPSGVLHCLRNDGRIVALTWQEEQDVWGWSLLETDGVIESICSVPENGVDTIYAIVQRVIDGSTRRYVERLTRPLWIDDTWTAQEDAVVCDAAVTIRGGPFSAVSRLDHLEGEAVSVLADGMVKTGHSVVDGRLTPDLDAAYSTVTIGLPYRSYIRTLPVVAQMQGVGSTKGRRATVAKVIIEVMNTFGIRIGRGDEREPEKLYDAEFPDYSQQTSPRPLYTGTFDTESFPPGDWDEALVTIAQDDPLPMVILGVFPDIETGK